MSGLTKPRSGKSSNGRLAQALFLSTAIMTFWEANAAHAGTAAPVNALATSAVAAAADGELSQVVVTARKREENLQDVPVSVTALSGGQIANLNIRSFQDLRGAVPNLEVLPLATGGASMTIRGIGQTSSQVNVDAKAGFYFDDVYIARQEGNQLYFYDVASLQVLKGPQGTLFGKNTTAGAVLLTPTRPGRDGGGYVMVRAGAYNHLDTEGAINVPISDDLLTRFSFRTQNIDGYITHVLDNGASNNVNDKSARFQARWTPTGKLMVDLLAEYDQSNTTGSTTIETGCRSAAAYVRNYDALHTVPLCTAFPAPSGRYRVYGGATLSVPTSSLITDVATGGSVSSGNLTRHGHPGPFNDTNIRTIDVRASYALTEDITLKSISGYRRSGSEWYNPTLNAPNDIYAEFDNTQTTEYTQEFNLTGQAIGGRLNYVAGAYYFHQQTHFLQDTGPDWIDPVGYTYDANNKFESLAAYVQASFKIIDALELTVGGRYSSDRKSANSDVFLQTSFVAPCAGFVNAFKTGTACGGHLTGSGSNSWSSFDPKAELSYRFTPELMTYVSVTRGYNAGGFNQQLGSNLGGILVPYDPERVVAYEAGVKSEWWDHRLRLNVSGFYQKYSDIQTTVLINIRGVDTRQVQTGASAHEQGLEAEVEVAPIPDLILRANGAILDQAYDSIRPGVTSITLTTPVNTAAKYSYSLSGDYVFHLPSDATLRADVNWRAVGSKPSCNPVGSCSVPAYGLLGARMEYRPGGDSSWAVALWGTNLLDHYVQLSKNVGGSMGIDSFVPGRPREYGIEVKHSF